MLIVLVCVVGVITAFARAIASCLPLSNGHVEATVDCDLERLSLCLHTWGLQGVCRLDSLHFMSAGHRGALSLVADTARSMAMLNPCSQSRAENSGIVHIVEIDLHLHPLWQALDVARYELEGRMNR